MEWRVRRATRQIDTGADQHVDFHQPAKHDTRARIGWSVQAGVRDSEIDPLPARGAQGDACEVETRKPSGRIESPQVVVCG